MAADTAQEMRSRINDYATYPPPYYEQDLEYSPFGEGTSHLSVLAENGDAVAVTSTINTQYVSEGAVFLITFICFHILSIIYHK